MIMPTYNFSDFANITDHGNRITPKSNPATSISVDKDNLYINDQYFPKTLGETGMVLASDGRGIRYTDPASIAGLQGVTGFAGLQGVTGLSLFNDDTDKNYVPYRLNVTGNQYDNSPIRANYTDDILSVGLWDNTDVASYRNVQLGNSTNVTFFSNSTGTLHFTIGAKVIDTAGSLSFKGVSTTNGSIRVQMIPAEPISYLQIDKGAVPTNIGDELVYNPVFSISMPDSGLGAITCGGIMAYGVVTAIYGLTVLTGTVSLPSITCSGLSGSGNRALYADPDGNLTTDSSDEKLKKNVTPLSNCLSKVMKLEPVMFNWINEKKGLQNEIGLIAQQVKEIVPEVVGTDANGMLTLNYAHLTAVLIGAIKELVGNKCL